MAEWRRRNGLSKAKVGDTLSVYFVFSRRRKERQTDGTENTLEQEDKRDKIKSFLSSKNLRDECSELESSIDRH